MSEPFLAEVKIVSFNFAPKGWALCDGQLLPINQNQALFSLLGTTYGGDGQTTFALPDLRGRVPLHVGNGYWLGHSGGAEAHTLTSAELPQHLHTVAAASADASALAPGGHLPAATPAPIYADGTNLVALHAASTSAAGGSQPHTNLQPSLTINFVIALQGIFPSHS